MACQEERKIKNAHEEPLSKERKKSLSSAPKHFVEEKQVLIYNVLNLIVHLTLTWSRTDICCALTPTLIRDTISSAVRDL